MAAEKVLYRINQCLVGFSRREADKIIKAGRVRINSGKIAELGEKIAPGDVITLDNKIVHWESFVNNQFKQQLNDESIPITQISSKESKMVYLKLWKEKDVICTASENDPTNIISAYKLDKHFQNIRLFPVGRLDKDSTGLILLTSDPSFQHLLLHSDAVTEKTYEVGLNKRATPEALLKWRNGMAGFKSSHY